MGSGQDFRRRRREEPGDVGFPDTARAAGGESAQQRGQSPDDLKPPEELVANAGMRERQLELMTQLERARAREAVYEERYGMTFDEFQASFDPRADAILSEDYLAWSRAAEQVRMLRHELARLEGRAARRARKSEPAAGNAGEADRRGPVS